MTPPLEATRQRAILGWLSRIPCAYFWRANTGVSTGADGRRIQFGVRGQADIIGVVDGRFVAIEVKSATGRQRPDQRVWEAAIRRAGGIYILARTLRDALEPVYAAAGLPIPDGIPEFADDR